MPLYEYVCSDCDLRFDQLRPVGRMDEPAACPQGHAAVTHRVLSTFAALSKDALGEAVPMSGGGCGGGGGCTNCACGAN